MNKNRKLKLCLIGDISNVHCKRWANYFAEKGHEVHFVDNHYYKYKNLKLHYLKDYTRIKLIDYLSRLIRAKYIIRKIKPDLVHSQQLTYHGFLGALSDAHPYIVTPWGSDTLFDYEKSFVHKYIIKYALDKADIIHQIDMNGVERVNQIYGDHRGRLFLLNEGVDTKVYRKKRFSKKNKITLLSIRVPKESYNTLLFVEALNIIINKYGIKNIIAVMCNEGDKIARDRFYEKRLNGLINKYNLRKYMRFFRYTREVYYTQHLMENADIYVDTMYRTVRGQGFGKTGLEAMSSALALVIPDNPDVTIYVKHMQNGLLYKKNDAEALAKAIVKLVENKKLREKLGRSARKFILKNYDWEKNIKLLEDKYYELANRPKKKNFLN